MNETHVDGMHCLRAAAEPAQGREGESDAAMWTMDELSVPLIS